MRDPIERQDAIDALADYIHNVDKVMGTGHMTEDDCKDAATSVFEELPSAQPGITLESAIDYLHSIGWMQEHDRTLTESAQPEIIRCKDCKFFVSDMEWCEADDEHPTSPDAFCSWAERRDG